MGCHRIQLLSTKHHLPRAWGLPTPWRGAKPVPEQPGRLRDRVLRDCTSSNTTFPMRRCRAEQEGESAPGWATRELTLGRVPPAECLRRTSHRRRPPRNSFLSSSALSICCLLRLSLPSQPSPAGRAFPLKGEREGEKEMKWRGGGEKKNKIKSKGEARLCQGWAAAKPLLCSSSASQQCPVQPPAQLGGGPASSDPSVEQIPGPRDVHACVCACINKRDLGRRRRREAVSPMRRGAPPTSSLHPLWGPFAEQNLRLTPGGRA